MSIGLPDIDINFYQKAITAITRSERGIACIVVYDAKNTGSAATVKTYKYAADVASDDYSSDNYAAIQRCWLVAVNKVIVVTVPASAKFSVVQAALEKLTYNYVCVVSSDNQQALVSYILTKNATSKGKKYVAVVTGVTTADSKWVINVKNTTVTETGADAAITMVNYLPRITSLLANLPMNRSCTYYELEDLEDVDLSFVTDDDTIDSVINAGNLVLFVDGDVVRIARGVNTLTTFTSTDTEDMRKIIIVEAMDLILEDIYTTFKESYIGKYKNSYDNQCLFISAVNAYFRQLANQEILDNSFDNSAFVDVETQRNAWISIGKTAAEDWTENEVKEMTYKSFIYLAGDIKILDAIEDLHFDITME